ncbi:hypothetical protein GCM10009610_18360 [Pseudonocardia xinjiangensis]
MPSEAVWSCLEGGAMQLLYGVAVLAGGREMLMMMYGQHHWSDADGVEQRFADLTGRTAGCQ